MSDMISDRPPIGVLVRVLPPYLMGGRPGVDAWTGRVMRVLAWSNDDALLGRHDETDPDEYDVAIHVGRLAKPHPRCSGCGTRDHAEDVRCPRAPTPQPTAWDETTETADDVSWGAAYGDAGWWGVSG